MPGDHDDDYRRYQFSRSCDRYISFWMFVCLVAFVFLGCPQEHTVSAVTEEIVLEGVDLGRFEIALKWDKLGCSQPYAVIALDPNPAASSSDTTHPHVQDGSLCEGDGRMPIRQALRQGRLLDFFIMVRQVLETYNAASAYVSLDQWHGIDCHDCGRLVAGDDRYTCERCEVDVCGDCST